MDSAGVICPDDEDVRMAEEDSPEESSWTFYIEGFMRDDDDDSNSLSSASEMTESPSLVSDAASSAVVAKKLSSYYNCVCRSNTDDDDNGGACRLGFTSAAAKGSIRTMFKQNSFKKQKTKVFLPSVMDYDLEDTASSPVNSPKVSYMNMNEKDKAKIDVSEVKRKSIGKGGIFAVERDNNYTDLQKRTYD